MLAFRLCSALIFEQQPSLRELNRNQIIIQEKREHGARNPDRFCASEVRTRTCANCQLLHHTVDIHVLGGERKRVSDLNDAI